MAMAVGTPRVARAEGEVALVKYEFDYDDIACDVSVI